MGKNWIPQPDAKFDEWFHNFFTQLVPIGQQVGLSQDEIDAVKEAEESWSMKYQAHIAAAAAARSARELKDDTRDNAEHTIRRVVRELQANPHLTDEQRKLLGITVPDTHPTPQSPDYILTVPPPMISLDFSIRGQITVHFGVNPQNERENAKPEGVSGAKIWYRIVGDNAVWNFLADDTNSPYVHQISTTTPIVVEYKAQWFDRHLRPGPFGESAQASVTP